MCTSGAHKKKSSSGKRQHPPLKFESDPIVDYVLKIESIHHFRDPLLEQLLCKSVLANYMRRKSVSL